METFNLEQAAAFLKMHPVTVQGKARSGEIPAAKPGKCWAFIKDDLVSYLRSFYSPEWRTLEGDTKEKLLCHFTSVRLSLIHISEPTRLGMISYAVFCLKK